ncbi:low temperature requirement protein A [Micromonospora sp. NBC_01699]|uniref:low temperature requirement protein A n=1 Tax=Micromonospora sp. NBC_01699 TaxID=2975984 RepID=UPI002E29BB8B|nr:low temperature requirement protein A [Micromonospora sp. NBC_01699]
MATDRAADLVREPDEPERATFIELLFDVVFAFALTRVSQQLLESIDSGRRIEWLPFGETLVLSVAVWNVWTFTCWTTSRFNRLAGSLHVTISALILGSLLMAVGLPKAFEDRGLLFAGAYAASQIGRPLIIVLALGNHPRRENSLRMLCWAVASGVFWIVGAFLPGALRMLFWAVGIGIDYLGIRFGWPVPGLGRERNERWRLAGEHLAERYQQFYILALGESVLFTGLTYSDGDLTFGRTLAFLISLGSTLLLWHIYFFEAGRSLPDAMARAGRPSELGQSSNYTQYALVAGVLATAVANELAIDDPFGSPHLAFVAVTLGGPAIFLAARLRFEYEVFGRLNLSLVIGPLALCALIPVMLFPPALVATITAAGVLAAVSAVQLVRRRQGRTVEPAPPF